MCVHICISWCQYAIAVMSGARLWCREVGREGGRSRTFYKHMHTFVTTWCQHAIAVMLVSQTLVPGGGGVRSRTFYSTCML